MKVASVTNTTLDPSLGSGKTVLAWTHELRRRGATVDIYEPRDFFRPLAMNLIRRLKLRFDSNKLFNRLSTSNYDLIEFYGGEFGWLITRLKKQKKHPMLVAHTNGLELLATESLPRIASPSVRSLARLPVNALVQHCDKLAFRNVERFVSICKLDAEYIIDRGFLPRDATCVIEPGIDDEFMQRLVSNGKQSRVIFMGTWSERKDTKTITSVMNSILKLNTNLIFDILGTGGIAAEVRSGFDESVRDRIVVYPTLQKKEMAEVLSAAKVFFFPSLYEGYGMATAEAMACGCAVVVTPTGFGGMIENDLEGIVCNFRDVLSMTNAIQALLDNDERRQKLSDNGRRRVTNLAWNAQGKILYDTYSKWLINHR